MAGEGPDYLAEVFVWAVCVSVFLWACAEIGHLLGWISLTGGAG